MNVLHKKHRLGIHEGVIQKSQNRVLHIQMWCIKDLIFQEYVHCVSLYGIGLFGGPLSKFVVVWWYRLVRHESATGGSGGGLPLELYLSECLWTMEIEQKDFSGLFLSPLIK